jgi:hypothetical protein
MRRLSFLTRQKVVLLLVVRAADGYALEASEWSPLSPSELAIIRTGALVVPAL